MENIKNIKDDDLKVATGGFKQLPDGNYSFKEGDAFKVFRRIYEIREDYDCVGFNDLVNVYEYFFNDDNYDHIRFCEMTRELVRNIIKGEYDGNYNIHK